MRTPTLEIEQGTRTRRVGLKPAGPPTGDVDGAWWPGSRDLSAELPGLVASVAARLGWVERVTYNLSVWAPAPRRVVVEGRMVRLEGFRSQPAGVVTVIGRGGQRLTLLVVPPDTDPAAADQVLARAALPDGVDSVETLLATARVAGTPNGGGCATQRWEGEGGTVAARA